MWYNKITHELQSEKPMKNIVNEEYWKSTYGDWEQVDINFIPPAAVPTKEQLLLSLDTEYQPQFAELSRALGLASLAENQLGIQGIKEDYNALLTEYNAKRGVING
jgi:hypothetical protein